MYEKMTSEEIKELAKKYDVQIGNNVRVLRNAKGITQQALADTLGITFQQVQKYENGSNRLSGSRIIMVAHALGRAYNDILNIDWTDGTLMEIESRSAKDLKELTKLRKFRTNIRSAISKMQKG